MKNDNNVKKFLIRFQPWIAILGMTIAVSQIGVFELTKQNVDIDRTPINPWYIFKNVNLPYKEGCLPSKYQLPFSKVNDPQLLRYNGITLNIPEPDNIGFTFSIVDCNDEQGTANLLVNFSQKYKDAKIPISGFLKSSQYLDLNFNQVYFDVYSALPSYFIDNQNELLKFVNLGNSYIGSDMALDDIKVSITDFNDKYGYMYIKYQLRGLETTIKATGANEVSLINDVFSNMNRSSISSSSSSTIATSFNSLETVFNMKNVKYKYNKSFLKMSGPEFNSTKTNVSYKLIYGDYSDSRTLNCLSDTSWSFRLFGN